MLSRQSSGEQYPALLPVTPVSRNPGGGQQSSVSIVSPSYNSFNNEDESYQKLASELDISSDEVHRIVENQVDASRRHTGRFVRIQQNAEQELRPLRLSRDNVRSLLRDRERVKINEMYKNSTIFSAWCSGCIVTIIVVILVYNFIWN